MKNEPWKICSSICLAALLTPSVAAAASDDEWEFQLAPLFLWGVSIDGSATIGDQEAPLDLAFTDEIFDNLEMAFTFHFEARKGKLTLFTEYQYLDLEPTIGVGPVEADIVFKDTMFEAGVGWAFSESDKTRWEVLGGVRYTDQEIDIDAFIDFPEPPLGPGPKEVPISGGDDWWQGLLGVRVQHKITDKWSFIARADYGYGDSDNTATNGVFFFDYRFNNWGSAFIGARIMDFDYDNGKDSSTAAHYAYDAKQTGPLMGLTIHW